MRISIVLLVSFLALVFPGTSLAQPENVTYTIIAPKVFRPASVYNVTATCYNAVADVNLNLHIEDSTGNVLVSQDTVLVNGVTQTTSLEVPSDVLEASYSLVAQGRGGLNFNDSSPVTVKRKTLSIFVQTDKAMYKPGQTVLLRAIVVYPDLKPYQGPVDIEIYDLAGNKIMQWLNQMNDTGVITHSLPLSDQTPLGNWQIVVTAEGNTLKKTFQVAEYVLPKFEVTVNLPSFYLVNTNRRDLQGDLLITVIAKYTYGQPVKGRANVTIQLSPYSSWDTSNYTQKIMNVQLDNGKADITIKIGDIMPLVPIPYYGDYYTPDPWNLLSYRTLLVVANVNETVTGIVLSGNSTVQCTNTKYKLEFLSISPSNYKPGLLYTAFLQLSKTDGSNPDSLDIMYSNGTYKTILFEYTLQYSSVYDSASNRWYYTPPVTKNMSLTVDPTGYMSVSLLLDSSANSVSLQASLYFELTNSTVYGYKSINAFKSRDNQSVQVSFDSLDGYIKAEEQITFRVKTTTPITTFQYELTSKGVIVTSGNVVENSASEHTLPIWISKDLATRLAPTARILIWFITPNGEIIADSTEVSVSDGFANEVTLSFDRNMTTPSQSVSLTVNAYSGSYIGLLAVDQSVLLLKGGNDITQDMVTQDLKGYDSTSYNYYPMAFDRRRKRSIWWPIFIDGSDSKTIIQNAGFLLITDGYLYTTTYTYYDRYPMFGAPGMAGAAGATGQQGPAGQPPPQNGVDGSKTADSSNGDSSQPRLDFPETWLWCDTYAGPDGKVTLQTSVPDTITSWVASAFALSRVAGLGVAANTAKVTVFKQFFLSPNLPYSIIRGEEFALQVTVFNYLTTQLNVLVTLQKSDYFNVKGNTAATAQVDSNDAVSVYFWIVPTSLGQIPISITGTSPVAQDAVQVMLLVKPEGVKQQYSTSIFMQLQSSGSTYNTTLDVTLPPKGTLVPGSESVEVTVIGDIMGSALQSLDNLLQMPYGCGEQNMLNFAPDVYIVKYLTSSDQLTTDIKNKALGYMNAGYQRELTYQRTDGSFSAFGNSDASGSTWLSSFVVKCFHQAKDYIPVEDVKIAITIEWIIQNQAKNGSFVEPPLGRVIHVAMQGGSSSGLALTAYVLIALIENQNNSMVNYTSLDNSIGRARVYLETQVASVSSDPYTLSIVAYALVRAKSSMVNQVLVNLEALAKIEAGTRHWEQTSNIQDDTPMFGWRPPYSQARSVNIEATSYALLVYCELKNFSMALPIAKWIIAQRNANGGFSSTQDTVMALEALAEFASLIHGTSGARNLVVSIATDSVQYSFQPITSDTSILLQSYEVPSSTRKIFVSATGTGSALLQLNVKYNVYKTEDNSGIELDVNTTQDGNKITIKSCSRWTKKEGSGMVVMEINQLTGYKPSNIDDLKNQIENNVLKRTDSTDEQVILYFDQLTSNETCIELISNKVYPVANVKDAPVKIYPYYDPSDARIVLYGAQVQADACSQCPSCCATTPASQLSGDGSTRSAAVPTISSFKFCSTVTSVIVFIQFCVALL